MKNFVGCGRIAGAPIVLVTGAAGFIGSNICRTLLEKGRKVYGVDNFITGKKENIVPLLRHKGFYFFRMDIIKNGFKNKFSKIRLDQVYHLACPTGVPNIQKLSEEMILTSSLGTLNVLEIAKVSRARLVFSSTAEIYGQPKVFPQNEEYTGNVNPIGPRSPYEEGKRFSEALIAMYVRKHNLDAKIVRIFNAYGPGMSLDDWRVIPHFLKKILAGEKVVIYGDGKQTRTFIYISDLINGLLVVMEKGKPGEPYNIGGDRELSIKSLADLIIKFTGRKNGLSFVPHFTEDHKRRRPYLGKIKKLGWHQRVSLEDGLKRMLAANGFK